MHLFLLSIGLFLGPFVAVLNGTGASAWAASKPDWSASAQISTTGRANPYGWDAATFSEKTRLGQLHAVDYPVEPTGILLPARPTLKLLGMKPGDPNFGLLKSVLSISRDFKNFTGFWDWLGLHDYPTDGSVPYPDGVRPDYPMGVSIIRRNHQDGFTLSCAACHSSELFGRKILGLTNRFPRANEMFSAGQSILGIIHPNTFAALTGATREEMEMYRDARKHIVSIGIKKPSALGLDTSLAQVALSLARRKNDAWAERTDYDAKHPRPNLMDHLIADSKPAVWWNVKYKTRWLSDGSVVSGNPIFTNFLWNEIGRGADLPELVDWLKQNPSIVEELTTAVFATKAPKYREFFGPNSIQVERAKRGEALFVQNCAHCHGRYEKDWSASPETIRVDYFATTPVRDVGTDPGRREGMQALADALNPLAFSQEFNIVIEPQKGYVPPPLEGIWARYPYLHNNSIPNLCALMTPPEKRPVVYYSGQAIDPNRDYDQECVGYPLGDRTPAAWKKDDVYRFDTRKPGLSNEGHYDRIFRNEAGQERYTPDQKRDLIEYLKSL